METIIELRAMQGWADARRREGRRIGLVPTMGFLHDGHLALVAEARRRADATVASIFVNPTQFGPSEDFASYPRAFERDRAMLESAGVDVLFTPEVDGMYPRGFETHVEVEQATRGLCGATRPGHFRGVTTVVAKLFHLTKPHVALFGEKDFQQLAVIRRMARDLDFDIEIVGVRTVREADGLAMSSRNTYLGPAERRAALCLPRGLAAARDLAASGERDALRLVAATRRVISDEPGARIDYVTLADPDTMQDLPEIADRALLAAAIWIGRTRLIDNCILKTPSAPPPNSDSGDRQ